MGLSRDAFMHTKEIFMMTFILAQKDAPALLYQRNTPCKGFNGALERIVMDILWNYTKQSVVENIGVRLFVEWLIAERTRHTSSKILTDTL